MAASVAQRVERLGRGDADPAALARRVAPDAVVPAELAAVLVDDRALGGLEAAALEEGAVVVAGEEAGLLALAALGDVEAGSGRLGARLRLRLLAERELDPVEQRRVERGEHVGLILVRVGRAGEQPPAVALDDARVVAGPELRRSGALGEGEQLVEAEAAVAAAARVRRLAARVAATKGSTTARRNSSRRSSVTCGSPSAWQVSRAAMTASGEQQARSESGPAGSSQSRSVTPIALRPGAEQRDGAVDAAAHRDRDALRDRARRGRPRPIAFASASAASVSPAPQPPRAASAREGRVEPGRVGVDDPVALDREPHERELGAARGVSDDLDHPLSLATKHG